MKKGLYLFVMVAALVFCTNTIYGGSSALDSTSFAPLTQKSISVKNNSYSWTDYKIKFTIIHPDAAINYGKNNIELETKLKKDYDLFFVEIGPIPERNTFNLYDLKTKVLLKIDQDTYQSIDFYDTSIKPNGRAYFSDVTFSYLGRGDVTILGYMLFPKSITNDSASLEISYGKDVLIWDLDKINKMIDILSD